MDIMVESSRDHIEGSTLILLDFNISKENMPVFMLVYSYAVMSYPGTLGMAFFESSNNTNFFD